MKFKLGIIGTGKMGCSILSGIVKSKLYNKEEILLYDVNEDVKNKLIKDGFKFSNNEQELFDKSEKIIIAIKPQMFYNLERLNYKENHLIIISIAAGKTINDLKKIFGNQKFVRVMPNTPALLNRGATAIARCEKINDQEFDEVKKIFTSIGIVEEIEENKMNEIIPVNGSMPAFLYYFVKAYIEKACEYKIDYEVAKKLACEAVIGSCMMIMENNKTIDELIKDVCSPGGATLAGLKVFDEEKLNEIIKKSYDECVKRAYELS